jgi:hypothetical protein
MCFVERNKRDGWIILRWFWTTNLSTRTKNWASDLLEEDEHQGLLKGVGRPGRTGLGASLLLPTRFFSSALTLALLLRDRVLHGVAPSKCSRPLLYLHYCSFHLMISLWVTSMLPRLTCLHNIPAKQGLGCPPCLSFACGLIKDVGEASRDASWCMHG